MFFYIMFFSVYTWDDLRVHATDGGLPAVHFLLLLEHTRLSGGFLRTV